MPDLAGWRVERMPGLPDTAWFTVAPDWVCEVLSRSTENLDRGEKLPYYAALRSAQCAPRLAARKLHEFSYLRVDGSRLTSACRRLNFRPWARTHRRVVAPAARPSPLAHPSTVVNAAFSPDRMEDEFASWFDRSAPRPNRCASTTQL